MLEEPPILKVAKKLRRPNKAQIKAFKNVPTSYVVDAMFGDGALSNKIRPLGESQDLKSVASGPALTVHSGAGDVLALLASMASVKKGDLIVNSFDGFQGSASAGDRVLGMFKNNGAAGFVTDGPVRDYAGIVKVGLPCWATGLTPASPYNSGPGSIGFPVQVGGKQIETGDMIVADHDGVVVVPYARIDGVIAALKTIIVAENALDAKVAKGLKILPSTKQLLKSKATRYE